MKPDRATFTLKDADAHLFDIGKVAICCDVDWDMERREWRASDEHGNEAWAEWKPLAAARLFVARMERDGVLPLVDVVDLDDGVASERYEREIESHWP